MAARKRSTVKKKKCSSCGNELSLMNGFYSSKSPMFAVDKKINICKECFVNGCIDTDTGEIDEEKLKGMLRRCDFPYYRDNLKSATDQFAKEHSYVEDDDVKYHGKDIIKLYMKNVNTLRQLSGKTFEDSERDGFIQKNGKVLKHADENIDKLDKVNKKHKEQKIKTDVSDFEVTNEIIELFGDGYTRSEYKKMYEKYEKLKLNYSLQTNLHQEALATYVRFKVKEEMATAEGRFDEAKKWYDMAQNQATNGKLTPKALSAADLQKGMNSVSELIKAVEQATDVIKILPQFKYRPNDSVDFTIMCYINYERKLNGQPEVPYEDIYKFYDEKKMQYIKQNGDPFGIFTDDPTESNRETVKTFLKMPDDYDELAGNDND